MKAFLTQLDWFFLLQDWERHIKDHWFRSVLWSGSPMSSEAGWEMLDEDRKQEHLRASAVTHLILSAELTGVREGYVTQEWASENKLTQEQTREWTSKHAQSESVKERPDECPNAFLNCIDARAVLPSSSSITVASCEWQRWGLFGWRWGDPWGRSWPGLWAGHGFPREEQRAATRTRLDHWDWPAVQQRFVQFRNSLEKPSVVTWLSKVF